MWLGDRHSEPRRTRCGDSSRATTADSEVPRLTGLPLPDLPTSELPRLEGRAPIVRVRAGDSLWSIASELVGPKASNARSRRLCQRSLPTQRARDRTRPGSDPSRYRTHPTRRNQMSIAFEPAVALASQARPRRAPATSRARTRSSYTQGVAGAHVSPRQRTAGRAGLPEAHAGRGGRASRRTPLPKRGRRSSSKQWSRRSPTTAP